MFTQAFIGTIKVYQRISALFSFRSCRFYPSCSQYAADSVQKYGVIKGVGKALWRILRCSPLSQGGHDPVR